MHTGNEVPQIDPDDPEGEYNHECDSWKKCLAPHCIYFYYVTPDPHTGNKPWHFRAYTYVNTGEDGKELPIPREALAAEVKKLVANARAKGNNPSPCGWAFGDVQWRRVSYLVVALDDPDDYFIPGNAVKIRRMVRDRPHGNHCFFSGCETSGLQNEFGDINVLWMVNYMKNRSGKKIPSKTSHGFKFYFNTNKSQVHIGDIEERIKPPSHLRRLFSLFITSHFDDGDSGTNMGPPVPPPSG